MLKSGLSGPLFISGFDFSESSTVQEASNAPVITDEYRRMQQAMHEDPNFGVASVGYAPYVAQVLARANATEFLDYGAGKGRLGEALKTILKRPLKVHHYDPAVPQWAAPPAPCKFVACIDVLEHIEPDLLTNVLDHLCVLTLGIAVVTVHTGPAKKLLPDGRNAHLIQQPPAWWLPKFLQRFELANYTKMPNGFFAVLERPAPALTPMANR
jgi:hypothetical protein